MVADDKGCHLGNFLEYLSSSLCATLRFKKNPMFFKSEVVSCSAVFSVLSYPPSSRYRVSLWD